MPAIGASTTAGSTVSAPRRSGGSTVVVGSRMAVTPTRIGGARQCPGRRRRGTVPPATPAPPAPARRPCRPRPGGGVPVELSGRWRPGGHDRRPDWAVGAPPPSRGVRVPRSSPAPLAAAGALVPGAERIAVLRSNLLGDLVLTLPALTALRAAYPDAEITYLGRP